MESEKALFMKKILVVSSFLLMGPSSVWASMPTCTKREVPPYVAGILMNHIMNYEDSFEPIGACSLSYPEVMEFYRIAQRLLNVYRPEGMLVLDESYFPGRVQQGHRYRLPADLDEAVRTFVDLHKSFRFHKDAAADAIIRAYEFIHRRLPAYEAAPLREGSLFKVLAVLIGKLFSEYSLSPRLTATQQAWLDQVCMDVVNEYNERSELLPRNRVNTLSSWGHIHGIATYPMR